MEQQSGIKTWQWVVTVIVIIILIIVGIKVFSNKDGDSMTPSDDTTIGTDTDDNSSDSNRIIINDQLPGNIVQVTSVQLANGGWVAIHKDNGGNPGAIIGTTYFEKGFNPGQVRVTPPTVEGGLYYAMLHSDDGDKVFDESKDLPIKDARGSIIMRIFRISSSIDPGFKG